MGPQMISIANLTFSFFFFFSHHFPRIKVYIFTFKLFKEGLYGKPMLVNRANDSEADCQLFRKPGMIKWSFWTCEVTKVFLAFEHDCQVNLDAWLRTSMNDSCLDVTAVRWRSIHFLPKISLSFALLCWNSAYPSPQSGGLSVLGGVQITPGIAVPWDAPQCEGMIKAITIKDII